MWKGKKSSSRLQGKITNGEGKELCKGSGTMKMFCMRSSPEIHKIKPGYMHHPLIQNLQVCDYYLKNNYSLLYLAIHGKI